MTADKPSQRRYQVQIFAATWLAYFGLYFCRKAFYIVKADLGQEFGLGPLELAHLGAAYLIAYMVGQFSSATFGRWLGPRLLLLAGMAISLICNAVFGFANSPWTVLVFIALNGLAQGTGWPGCIGSLAFWFSRERRGSVLGVWSTCYQLGSVAAGAFAAYWLGRLGYRASFFGASIVLLAIWFVVLLLHPNRPEDVGLAPLEDEGAPAGGAAEGWDRDTILSVLVMGLIYFCIKFLRYALWSWTPFFLRQNYGLEGDAAGYLSTVFDLSGFAGVLAAGFASDRLFGGRRAGVCLGMLVLMALSFVLLHTAGAFNLVLFAVAIGLAGFMLYGPDSLLSGVGAIDVGSRRGALAAAGIINGMGSIGPVFQEELVGGLYAAHGLGSVLVLLVSVAVAAVVLMAVLWLRARRGRTRL